jgi:hypothetical protein
MAASLSFQISKAISPAPSFRARRKIPTAANHAGGTINFAQEKNGRRGRKAALLLYQPEIGNYAMFLKIIFSLDAIS